MMILQYLPINTNESYGFYLESNRNTEFFELVLIIMK